MTGKSSSQARAVRRGFPPAVDRLPVVAELADEPLVEVRGGPLQAPMVVGQGAAVDPGHASVVRIQLGDLECRVVETDDRPCGLRGVLHPSGVGPLRDGTLEEELSALDPLEGRPSLTRRPALHEGLELPGSGETPER